uniref:hypothetical protein n=1 Tax=Pararhizobium sp. IMCC3301 TaxID=3067904 RepID=UPI0027426E28|nr:hypothetical protein [Pararhizobium sp. IMCC3301]
MSALLRLVFIVPFAYLAASAAAGLTIYGAWRSSDIVPMDGQFELILGGLVVAMAFAALAFPASLIGLIIAEIFRYRSFVGYVLLGLLNGTILSWAITDNQMFSQFGALFQDFFGEAFVLRFPASTTAYLAGGSAWGLVYWLLAGRSSGFGDPKRQD